MERRTRETEHWRVDTAVKDSDQRFQRVVDKNAAMLSTSFCFEIAEVPSRRTSDVFVDRSPVGWSLAFEEQQADGFFSPLQLFARPGKRRISHDDASRKGFHLPKEEKRKGQRGDVLRPNHLQRGAGTHAAERLQQGLHEIGDTPERNTRCAMTSAGILESEDDILRRKRKQLGRLLSGLPKVATSVGNLMQPKGICQTDRTRRQKIVNVVTSLPFFGLGGYMLHRHRTKEGREFALSMIAVGAAATLYHASSGKVRSVLRKADYWTISMASTCMLRALFPQHPRWIQVASFTAIPFRPFAMSTAYTLAMQAEFARQAMAHKRMRPHFCRHAVAASAGIIAFAFEEALAERGFEHSHAVWHCLAAAGVASTGALVEHKERMHSSDRLSKLRNRRVYDTSLESPRSQGSIHDSVTSLNTLASSRADGTPCSGKSVSKNS